jgi:hypothetical protein
MLRLLCTWVHESAETAAALSSLVALLAELCLTAASIHVEALAALLIAFILPVWRCTSLLSHATKQETSESSASLASVVQSIGLEKYLSRLQALRSDPHFIAAENSQIDPPLPSGTALAEAVLFYDYEFTLFYKDAFDRIQKTLKAPLRKSKPALSPRRKPQAQPQASAQPQAQAQAQAQRESKLEASSESALKFYKELVQNLV